MILGVIFDCDGVLHTAVDSDFRTWQRLFREEFSKVLDYDIYHNAAGGSGEEFIIKNAPYHVSPEIARELFLKQGHYFAEQIRIDGVKEPEGLSNLLRALSEAKIKMSVATSGNKPKAGGVIDYFGIRHYFPHVVTISDVTRGKPHPDLFLEAMRRMEVPPSQCAIIEDSPSGIRAAIASNASIVIGITQTHKREVLEQLGPHRIIDLFRELDVNYFK